MGHGTSDVASVDVEAVCQRFEAAWKSSGALSTRPRIQDYLSTLAEPERTIIFCALLKVELKCRQMGGEQPTLEEYCSLYPESAVVIKATFKSSGLGSRTATAALSSQLTETRTIGQRQLEQENTASYDPTDAPAPPMGDALCGRNGAGKPGAEVPSTFLIHEGAADADSDALPAVPGYEIYEELGSGGMGIVYKARDLRLQRLVALKMIRPDRELSSERRARFLGEASTVARFEHPNLVHIYAIGEHAGQPYFSLELLEGGDLKEKLAGTPQPATEAAELVEVLARAVEYAHQKGIVHRDLKPANILLAANGTPKIADFGLAKQVDQDSGFTEHGDIMGTPSYMAPEQAWGKNKDVGPAADIYALGAIFYEMLTGRPPFKGSDKWQTVVLVRTQEPVPPRRLVPQVPRDLELLCLKCLQKEPAERFASAGALADELRRFLEGRPIKTRPAPLWEQAWKWARRQPAVAALAAASVLAILSLLLFLDQRGRNAQRELEREQHTGLLRGNVQDLYFQAQKAQSDPGGLQDALRYLQKALGIVHSEPALVDREASLDALRTELQRRETNLVEAAKAQTSFQQFLQLRDSALFHGLVFEGVDLAANMKRTRDACQKALEIFGVRGDREGPSFTLHYTQEQQQRIQAGCFELLLVWAEAEAQPESGNSKPSPAQLQAALRLLDRAAGLDLPPTRTYHLRRANYLGQLGEESAARQERQRAGAAQAEGALDSFLTGTSHQKKDELREAAGAFVRALDFEPGHFWARYFLGVCNLRMGNHEQARANFTSCLGATSSFPDAFLWLHIWRGIAESQMNDFVAAERDYAQALTLQPSPQARYGILVNQGNLRLRQAQAIQGALSLPGSLPYLPSLDFAYRGVAESYRQARLAQAADYLQEAIGLEPDQYSAYGQLALVRREQRRLDDAVKLLEQALAADRVKSTSALAQLHAQRARVYRQQGKLEAALADLDAALELAPVADDYIERGRLLFSGADYQQAATAFAAAQRLRPVDAETHRLQAEALRLVPGETRATLDALDRYLDQGGRPTPEVYRLRGMLRAADKQYQGAMEDYYHALALQPDAATHTQRGWLYLANQSPHLALVDFEEALRLDPESREACAGRGLIRVLDNRHAEGLWDAEAALRPGRPQTATQTATLLWNIAHIYAQLAGQLCGEAGRPKAGFAKKHSDYQGGSLRLLRQALETEGPRGAAFWDKHVVHDGLLDPVRDTDEFQRLEQKYGKERRLASE